MVLTDPKILPVSPAFAPIESLIPSNFAAISVASF
jgi:hypothetical protein